MIINIIKRIDGFVTGCDNGCDNGRQYRVKILEIYYMVIIKKDVDYINDRLKKGVRKVKTNYANSKYLLVFFSTTLLWTWICGFIPVVFGFTGTSLGTFVFYFGGGAPSVVALFLVFFTYPKSTRKDYFHRCFSLRQVGWKWPVLLIAFFTAITVVSLVIGTKLLNLEIPRMDFLYGVIKAPYLIIVVFLISAISGPLNEEFGWRGYALDKLLVRFGFAGASLILGFIWAIWHLAWYFTPGQAQYNMLQHSIFNAVMFIPSCTLFSFVVSFVYIKTKRSILAGALTHMLSNLITSQLLSPYSPEISLIIRYTSMCFYIIVILYALTSQKFKYEVQAQIKQIRTDEERII